MQPSGNPYLDQFRTAQSSSPAPTASAPAQSGGGGILGVIGRAIEAPIKTAAEVPSTLYHSLTAAGIAGGSVLRGEHGNALTASKNAAKAELQKSPIFKGSTSDQAFNGGVGSQLEKLTGETASNVLNVAAPEGGAEALAGKEGIKALAVQGAKTGAKYGLAGGAANAAAQGGSGTDIAEGAGEGLLGGAALGGALGGAGSVVGKTLGKVAGGSAADEAGAGASTAVGNAKPGGILPKAAANAGARSAQNAQAQASIDFSGDAENQVNNVLSHDQQGNSIGIRSVQSMLRGNNMPQDAAGMETLANTSNTVLGGNLSDMTSGTTVNGSRATDVGVQAVRDNLGNPSKSGTTGGAADTAVRQIRQATSSLNENSSVDDVMKSISQLENSRADIGRAVNSGDAQAKGMDKAYQETIDHLHGLLNSGGVNKAVGDFKVSPQLADSINKTVTDEGGSPELAQHYIDTLNNAKSYGAVKSGMQMGVVGGKLAKIARDTFETSVAKPGSTRTATSIPSWEIAMSLHNPAYVAAATARLAQNSGIVDRVLSHVNPKGFNAAREAGLAPDAVTQGKLDNPGVAGTAASPDAEEPQIPTTTTAPVTTNSAPAPAEPVPEPSPANSGAASTGQPTNLSFAPSDSAPTPIPVNQGTSNLDSLIQQLGIRRNVEPTGQPTDSITGPIPASGSTMGAESQPATNVPVRTPTPTQTASASVPVGTRYAPPPTTVKVPVTGNQASGNIPMETVGRGERAVQAVANGAHRIAGGVSAADDAARAGAGNLARTLSNVVRSTSTAPAKVGNAAISTISSKSLLGALTGSATNQAGQTIGAPGTTTPDKANVAGTDANGTPTDWVTADQAGPTLDENTIPGGSLADLQAEIAADPKNASSYEAIYNDAQDQVKASIPKAPTAAQATGATSIQDAFGYLDTIEQELNALGGVNSKAGYEAQIPLLGKHLQPGIAAYNETKFDAATALAKALTGRAATAASLKLATSSLPSPTDSAAQAAQKLANVRLELANKAPDYGLVPANQ